MRIIYLATIMVFSCKLVFADDINWIKKAAEHYNLPPLSDYLQDASSSKHAFLEGSDSWPDWSTWFNGALRFVIPYWKLMKI